jgi:hypothetical protein
MPPKEHDAEQLVPEGLPVGTLEIERVNVTLLAHLHQLLAVERA